MFQKNTQGSYSGSKSKARKKPVEAGSSFGLPSTSAGFFLWPWRHRSKTLGSLNWSTLQLRTLCSSYTLLSGADVSVQEGSFTWRSVRSLEADTFSPSFLTDFERRRSLPSSFFTLRSYGSSNLQGYDLSSLHAKIQLHIQLSHRHNQKTHINIKPHFMFEIYNNYLSSHLFFIMNMEVQMNHKISAFM
jgi:hypothetical protein